MLTHVQAAVSHPEIAWSQDCSSTGGHGRETLGSDDACADLSTGRESRTPFELKTDQTRRENTCHMNLARSTGALLHISCATGHRQPRASELAIGDRQPCGLLRSWRQPDGGVVAATRPTAVRLPPAPIPSV